MHCSGGKINWLRFSTNRNEHLFYQSTIFLPDSSPVKQATGKPFLNQAAAVSSACLEAIQLLHQVILSIFGPECKKLSLVHWQVIGTSYCLLMGCIDSVLTGMSQRALRLLVLQLPSESLQFRVFGSLAHASLKSLGSGFKSIFVQAGVLNDHLIPVKHTGLPKTALHPTNQAAEMSQASLGQGATAGQLSSAASAMQSDRSVLRLSYLNESAT